MLKIKNIFYLILLLFFLKKNKTESNNKNSLESDVVLVFYDNLHKLKMNINTEDVPILWLLLKNIFSDSADFYKFKETLSKLNKDKKDNKNTLIKIIYIVINSNLNNNEQLKQNMLILIKLIISSKHIDINKLKKEIKDYFIQLNIPTQYQNDDQIIAFIKDVQNLNNQLTTIYIDINNDNKNEYNKNKNSLENLFKDAEKALAKKKEAPNYKGTFIEEYLDKMENRENFIPEYTAEDAKNMIIYISNIEEIPYYLVRIKNNQKYTIIFPYQSKNPESKKKVYEEILKNKNYFNELERGNIRLRLFNLNQLYNNNNCYTVLREEGYDQDNITVVNRNNQLSILQPNKSNTIFKQAMESFIIDFNNNTIKPNINDIAEKLNKIIITKIFESGDIKYIIIDPEYIENLFLEILKEIPLEKRTHPDVNQFLSDFSGNKCNCKTDLIRKIIYNIMQTNLPFTKFCITNQNEQKNLKKFGAINYNQKKLQNIANYSKIHLDMYIFFVYHLGIKASSEESHSMQYFLNDLLNETKKDHSKNIDDYEEVIIRKFITMLEKLVNEDIESCIKILKCINITNDSLFKYLQKNDMLKKDMIIPYVQNQKWLKKIISEINNHSQILQEIKNDFAKNSLEEERENNEILHLKEKIRTIISSNSDDKIPIQIEVTKSIPIEKYDIELTKKLVDFLQKFSTVIGSQKDCFDHKKAFEVAFAQSDTCTWIFGGKAGSGKTTDAYILYECLKKIIEINYSPEMSKKLIFVEFKGGLKTIYQNTESHAMSVFCNVIKELTRLGYIPICLLDEITIKDAKTNAKTTDEKITEDKDINSVPEDVFKNISNELKKIGAIVICTGNHAMPISDAIKRRCRYSEKESPDPTKPEDALKDISKSYWNQCEKAHDNFEQEWHKYLLLKDIHPLSKLFQDIFLPDILNQIKQASKTIEEALLELEIRDLASYMTAQNFILLCTASEGRIKKTAEKIQNDYDNGKLPKLNLNELKANPDQYTKNNESISGAVNETGQSFLQNTKIPLNNSIFIPGDILAKVWKMISDYLNNYLKEYYSEYEKIINQFEEEFKKSCLIDLKKELMIEYISRIAAAANDQESLYHFWIAQFLKTSNNYSNITNFFINNHIKYDSNKDIHFIPSSKIENSIKIIKIDPLISTILNNLTADEREMWECLKLIAKNFDIDPRYILSEIGKNNISGGASAFAKAHTKFIVLNFKYLTTLRFTSKKLDECFNKKDEIKKIFLYTFSPVPFYNKEELDFISKRNHNQTNDFYNTMHNVVAEINRSRYIACMKFSILFKELKQIKDESFILSTLTLYGYNKQTQMINFDKISSFIELLYHIGLDTITIEKVKSALTELNATSNIVTRNIAINQAISLSKTSFGSTNFNFNKFLIYLLDKSDTPYISHEEYQKREKYLKESIQFEQKNANFLNLLSEYKDLLTEGSAENWLKLFICAKQRAVNQEIVEPLCKKNTNIKMIEEICNKINDNNDNNDNIDTKNNKEISKINYSMAIKDILNK